MPGPSILPLCPPDCVNFTTLYGSSSIRYPAVNATLEGGVAYTIAMWVRFTNLTQAKSTS